MCASCNRWAGAESLITETINTARQAGLTGDIVVRADSAFYCERFMASCRRHGAHFSVTAKMSAKLAGAIAGIDESAWVPIAYPHAVFDEQSGQWISDAQIAEIPYTIESHRAHQRLQARLIVRRVRDQHRRPHLLAGSLEVLSDWPDRGATRTGLADGNPHCLAEPLRSYILRRKGTFPLPVVTVTSSPLRVRAPHGQTLGWGLVIRLISSVLANAGGPGTQASLRPCSPQDTPICRSPDH